MNTIATIPFYGFYESRHSNALEYTVQTEPDEGEVEIDFNSIDFKAAHQDYAKLYAEDFLATLHLKGEFESLDSPMFYNFETDTVFVTLDESEVPNLIQKALKNHDALNTIIKLSFTGYDGFIPFYSNDIEEWTDKLNNEPNDLDHNELGIVIQAAYYNDEDFDEIQNDFAEDYQCNSGGYLDFIKNS